MRLIIARMGDGWGIILGMYNLYPPPAIFSGGGYSAGFCYLSALLSHNVYYGSDIACHKLANPLILLDNHRM